MIDNNTAILLMKLVIQMVIIHRKKSFVEKRRKRNDTANTFVTKHDNRLQLHPPILLFIIPYHIWVILCAGCPIDVHIVPRVLHLPLLLRAHDELRGQHVAGPGFDPVEYSRADSPLLRPLLLEG